jgi:hypothetical protein
MDNMLAQLILTGLAAYFGVGICVSLIILAGMLGRFDSLAWYGLAVATNAHKGHI